MKYNSRINIFFLYYVFKIRNLKKMVFKLLEGELNTVLNMFKNDGRWARLCSLIANVLMS